MVTLRNTLSVEAFMAEKRKEDLKQEILFYRATPRPEGQDRHSLTGVNSNRLTPVNSLLPSPLTTGTSIARLSVIKQSAPEKAWKLTAATAIVYTKMQLR
ncbi:hypothetical protein [Allorhizobium undicola]|uniref:hypothetical protein n=1 Tax=Allorhizobium undicola TaxID=78527 RepID=UPI0012B668C0|nr:hypothetical protein [Allorhizobium undicola]